MEILIGIFITAVIVSFVAGYGAKPAVSAPAKEKITILDSAGKYVEVPYPLERIVVLNSDVAEAICILGAEDKVIGVNDAVLERADLGLKFAGIATVGSWWAPSYETIIELDPEIVIAYREWPGPELEDRLEPLGIKVVRLEFYYPRIFVNDMKTIGLMLGREERADEYIDFIQGYLSIIEENVEELEEQDRVHVFVEGYPEYKTFTSDTSGHQMVVMAGGINVATEAPVSPVPYPTISSEWVLETNPQVVVKAMGKSVIGLARGYGATDETVEAMAELREEIKNRPGWSEMIDAVKDERVHLIASDIWGGPRMAVGICYMAKWFYPELFENLDPESIHEEILENFIGLEYKGVFVYP